MLIRKLLCPHCGAPLTPPGAVPSVTCQYCGNSFLVSAGRAAPLVQPRTGFIFLGVAVGAIFVALLIIVVKVLEAPSTRRTGHAPSKTPSASHRAPGQTLRVLPPISTRAEVEPPEPPISASFTFDHKWTSSIGSLWFYGRVKNDSSVAIGKPRVRAVLRDQAKADIATFTGYPNREGLLPGEVAPVTILVMKPPSYHDVAFEVSATAPFGSLKVLRGLRVQPLPPRPSSVQGYWEFEGKVTNDEKVAVQFAQVEVSLLGADGTLVGLGHSYVDARVLEPGATSRFQERIAVVAPHASVTYVSWGRPK